MRNVIVLAFAAMLGPQPVNAKPDRLDPLTDCAAFYGLVRSDRGAPARFSTSHILAMALAMNVAKAQKIRPEVWVQRYAKAGDMYLDELNATDISREAFIAKYDPMCSAFLKKSQ